MCKPPKYCSYCLKRMGASALRSGNAVRANQITSLLAERENLKLRPKGAPTGTINLKELKGKIAVDIDDTLGSFEADMRLALMRRDNLTYEEALERYPSNPAHGMASWWEDQEDPAGYSYQQYLDLERRGLLYKDQPVREEAGEVLNKLYRETDGRVTFLTARPEAFNSVSTEWLGRRLGLTFPPEVKNSMKKEEVEDYEVLIDDSVPHVKAVSSPEAPHGARKTIFMTRPRTAEAVPAGENVIHAWSWSDVKRIFVGGDPSGEET